MSKQLKLGLALLGVLLVVAVTQELVRGLMVRTPDFSGTDLHGRPWRLADHRGREPVLVSFFATWCGPCAMEFPHLVELQKKYQSEGLQVVLLTQEPPSTLEQFPHYGAAPVTVLPNSAAAFQGYGVESLPKTVFFRRDGSVGLVFDGYSDRVVPQIEAELRKR